ncbi:auxin-induced protein 22D-like [Bidens hawaiensis]|uniref:auxin-induced protein 22D-like n=1 Tax=Bidens hawaiensis TaxID=980011 RepID=UPI00404B24BD
MELINFEATELRLGLPGSTEDHRDVKSTNSPVNSNKRSSPEMDSSVSDENDPSRSPPPTKAQVVGWPPVRSYRKNILQGKKSEPERGSGIYVKVSMDGAPYLRKVDLKVYKSYGELLKGLQAMFKCIIGLYSEREGYKSEYAPTYEDKDGDWMLLGDVPWDMFLPSCKRLRIMKSSEVIELTVSAFFFGRNKTTK